MMDSLRRKIKKLSLGLQIMSLIIQLLYVKIVTILYCKFISESLDFDKRTIPNPLPLASHPRAKRSPSTPPLGGNLSLFVVALNCLILQSIDGVL